jgi:predicted ferric reductase
VSPYTDPGQHIFWITSRALGIVALLLLSASVGLGLALSGRVARAPGVAGRLRHVHEALSLTALAAIAGHGLLLLGDGYLRPGLAGIAVPFALKGQPAWVGVGILGGWLSAVVGLSFYARRWIGSRTWRRLHRLTAAAFALSIVHAIGSGPDTRSLWLAVMLGVALAPVSLVATYRYLPRSSRTGALP